jgi:hypothetical protein
VYFPEKRLVAFWVSLFCVYLTTLSIVLIV